MLAVLSCGCAIKKHLNTNLKTDSTYHQVTLTKNTHTVHDTMNTAHYLTQTHYDSTTRLTYTFARPVTEKEIQQQTAPITTLTTTHHIHKQHAKQHHHHTRLTHTQHNHADSSQQTIRLHRTKTLSQSLQRQPSYIYPLLIASTVVILFIVLFRLKIFQ